jgi:hypothetical protein
MELVELMPFLVKEASAGATAPLAYAGPEIVPGCLSPALAGRPPPCKGTVNDRTVLLAADIRFWSPACMRGFTRTCRPKRPQVLQRLRAKNAARVLSRDSTCHVEVEVYDTSPATWTRHWQSLYKTFVRAVSRGALTQCHA